MKFRIRLRQVLQSLRSTFLPRFCCVCGKRLRSNEEHTCVQCLLKLPLTRIKGQRNNIIERIMWDDMVMTQRANSYLYYYPQTNTCNLFFDFKYHNRPDIAVAYGKLMAEDLMDTGFFDGIDLLVPIPLSKRRFKQRGYNQSERLAYGVSLVTGIPIDTKSVIRAADNPTQTHLQTYERQENVKDIFRVVNAADIRGKHLLLIDDMITTGSTLKACARSLILAAGVKVSVLTLGTSAKNKLRVFPDLR